MYEIHEKITTRQSVRDVGELQPFIYIFREKENIQRNNYCNHNATKLIQYKKICLKFLQFISYENLMQNPQSD